MQTWKIKWYKLMLEMRDDADWMEGLLYGKQEQVVISNSSFQKGWGVGIGIIIGTCYM